MKINKLRFFSIAVAVAALGVQAQPPQTSPTTQPALGSWDFKRVAKVGDTAKYKSSADFEMQGQKITASWTELEKIVKVDSNGDVTLESQQTEFTIQVAGQEMPGPEASKSTSVTRSTGEVIKLEGDGVNADAYRMSTLSAFIRPDKMVKVGDKWTHEFKANSKTGVVASKASYEVVGAEKVGAYDTVKVKFEVKETERSDAASASGIVWINVKDGMDVKVNAEFKKAPIPQVGPTDMKFTRERVS